MPKNIEIGAAGSVTVSILVIVFALLMRSFYKRYTRMEKRKDDAAQ
ncbi:MAG: hypothetical protein F2704_05900 [Actinobacteria bacterium]|uniref:Unannotated protein n=1 Tax=freshwater metagenome TaxID=449393 RepID=A0A6J7CG69_9ZZZZ|nr:hypothetical protein [Actinomycetota bacterium]MSW47280.1 hypothetical protein [Actinomycetota bacterium]MSX24175.1 hypothetical protein [Actinomycetota bacterium]MSY57773.1 hypothetical protein [Actinomycetota bacterium]MTB00309.1 hypothetical protein [Actinomycetota bacterium]